MRIYNIRDIPTIREDHAPSWPYFPSEKVDPPKVDALVGVDGSDARHDPHPRKSKRRFPEEAAPPCVNSE
jgi:hypothetical protein